MNRKSSASAEAVSSTTSSSGRSPVHAGDDYTLAPAAGQLIRAPLPVRGGEAPAARAERPVQVMEHQLEPGVWRPEFTFPRSEASGAGCR